MIRDSIGDQAYWDEAVRFGAYSIAHREEAVREPPGDPWYRPQYLFELVRDCYQHILERYSRGDEIEPLAKYFLPLLDAWEESVRLGKDVFTSEQQFTRRAWKVNLDHYIVCFWLVGLALVLEIPDSQWRRLLALVDNEGEDRLLDLVISTRQPDRKIGETLCHPKPYQRLLTAIEASPAEQGALLADFVKHWYAELDRPAKKGNAPATAMYERPYWYTLGNRQLHDSGYFGRWCVEAIAAVKAFGLDDSLCSGLPNYPGDFLRPEGPTTHPVPAHLVDPPSSIEPQVKPGLFARLFGKPKP